MPGKFFYRSSVRRVLDILAVPLTWTGALFLKYFRNDNGHKMPLTKKILLKRGVFPINDNYAEPLFNTKKQLARSLRTERKLPGIDWNIGEQLDILASFGYNNELLAIPLKKMAEAEYYYHNGIFEPGDSEYWYSMIRKFKPKRIIEVGCGYSTLMAIKAIAKNKSEDAAYSCEHICIEPYPEPRLQKIGINLLEKKAEDIDPVLFMNLEANDILFIDTSHIIRPQGDVVFLYLEILPQLKKGVFVHIHDIFTPRDYPDRWIIEENRLWNEQYLLEAFITMNKDFRIIGALNYLMHNFNEQLSGKLPVLANEKEREPGSFWMMKN